MSLWMIISRLSNKLKDSIRPLSVNIGRNSQDLKECGCINKLLFNEPFSRLG